MPASVPTPRVIQPSPTGGKLLQDILAGRILDAPS
jgi:hypothetical protein